MNMQAQALQTSCLPFIIQLMGVDGTLDVWGLWGRWLVHFRVFSWCLELWMGTRGRCLASSTFDGDACELTSLPVVAECKVN